MNRREFHKWRWATFPARKSRWFVDFDCEHELNTLFTRCTPVERLPDSCVGIARRVERTEDFPWTGILCPVVSERARDVIMPLVGDDIQCIPISIVHQSKPIAAQYFLLNCHRRIECLDKSRCEFEDAKYHRYPQLPRWHLFDYSLIPSDAMVFQVKYAEGKVVVRDSIRQAIEAARLTGCEFDEPEWPRPDQPFW